MSNSNNAQKVQGAGPNIGDGNPIDVNVLSGGGAANSSLVSAGNSSVVPLASLATFTGVWEYVADYDTVNVSAFADTNVDIIIEFSPDGVNSVTQYRKNVAFNSGGIFRCQAMAEWVRVSCQNMNALNQSVFILETFYRSIDDAGMPTIWQSPTPISKYNAPVVTPFFLNRNQDGMQMCQADNFAVPSVGFGYQFLFTAACQLTRGGNNFFYPTYSPEFSVTVQTAANGNTALWTPTLGTRFLLQRYMVMVTGNAATAGGAVVTISLNDNGAALPQAHDVFIPGAALAAGALYVSPWIDLGQGILSAAANNVLNVNLSAALTAGFVRVIACGVEQI